MTIYVINPDQPKLNCQIRNLDHETMITPTKNKSKQNYKVYFPINLILNDEIKK
jgi:hypothetical protein